MRILGSYQVGGPAPAPSDRGRDGAEAALDARGSERVTGVETATDMGAAASTGSRVLVLNATFEPIHVCTARRATVLLLKAKAEMIEHGDRTIRSEYFAIDRPVVIRLVQYVRIPRDIHRRKITRKAVLARDDWTCQYCGTERITGLTVDHVIPRSRGGESVWENIVASCAPCNRRKGNRLPPRDRDAPEKHPRPPGPNVFIRVAAPRVPASWEPYLGGPAARTLPETQSPEKDEGPPFRTALSPGAVLKQRGDLDDQAGRLPISLPCRCPGLDSPGGAHVPPSGPSPPASRKTCHSIRTTSFLWSAHLSKRGGRGLELLLLLRLT